MASYSIENSKSNRSSCKKCKEKIGKGELRIGVTVQARDGDHTMTSWYKVKCFNLPPKLKKAGETAESFVDNLLEDRTDDMILEAQRDQIIADIEWKAGGKKSTTGTDKLSLLKARLAERREAEDEDSPKKKKIKLSPDEEADLDIYASYEKHKVDELKDVLRWNRQALTGNKELLMSRILDGQRHGRLGRCPLCAQGKLKLAEANDEHATCPGYYDEETSSRVPCSFTCKLAEAPRLQPWFTEKPSEEEEEKMDKLADEAKGKAQPTEESSSGLLAKAGELEWDLPGDAGKAQIKKATKALVEICSADNVTKLGIPEGKETMEIGKIVVSNKGKSATEVMQAVVDRFGFADDKAAAAKKRSKAVASVCANPANAGLMEAFLELSNLYFKEKNSNAGATYRKVANAIKDIAFEITTDNAKGLSKGKTKVPNIGKASSDKMYEFCSTGTMAKLEEKRAAAEG